MQPLTHKADGLQHQQANDTAPDTTPLPRTDKVALKAPVVPEGCEKLYAAIHADEPGDGHMTWIK